MMKYIKLYEDIQIDFNDWDEYEIEDSKVITEDDIYIGNILYSKDDTDMNTGGKALIKDKGYKILDINYGNVYINSEFGEHHSWTDNMKHLNTYFYVKGVNEDLKIDFEDWDEEEIEYTNFKKGDGITILSGLEWWNHEGNRWDKRKVKERVRIEEIKHTSEINEILREVGYNEVPSTYEGLMIKIHGKWPWYKLDNDYINKNK